MPRATEPSLARGWGMREIRATQAPIAPPAASSYRSGPAAVLLCSHHYVLPGRFAGRGAQQELAELREGPQELVRVEGGIRRAHCAPGAPGTGRETNHAASGGTRWCAARGDDTALAGHRVPGTSVRWSRRTLADGGAKAVPN